uniref:Uncharacterized protein n=1 Tax=Cacopsylla melanoneura TaxID=428564 RepID=A0A8D8RLJ2_9HEMI
MFFHSKINSIPRKLDDNQLSSVTCLELKPLLLVCQLFGLVPFSLKSYQSTSHHYLVMALMATVVNCSIVLVIVFGPFRYMRKPMESVLFTIVHYIIMFIQLTCMSNVYIR